MAKYYGVATPTGADVFTSWEDAQTFMRDHPGKEFHKKFPTSEEAWGFVDTKMKEMGAVPSKHASYVERRMPVVSKECDGEDDVPPWD